MSVKYVNRAISFCDIFSPLLLIIIIFTSIYFFPCGAVENGSHIEPMKNYLSFPKGQNYPRLFKRNSGRRCLNTSECASALHGSVCIQNTCVCPQGYLPDKQGTIGCFQVGKHLGSYCNISAQCGEELTCRDHVCLCPEGFQLFHTQGINMCLFWHKPTRLVDRCRNNEDCVHLDPNTACKKHWCQCNNGYQLFETMLFGRKQKCFKTYRYQCINASQCSKLAESSDQYCICVFGVCHCMTDINSTALDLHNWSTGQSNWYQRWKKDLILATRLLFITVILFFVPCFIYVTLGVRERSRQLFSQFVQPSRSPAVHYSQRRTAILRPLRSYRSPTDMTSTLSSPGAGEVHHVEISLHPSGVNSRLVDSRPRLPSQAHSCEAARDQNQDSEIDMKEEDPPPSYEEIMRREIYPEAPPPPYREL